MIKTKQKNTPLWFVILCDIYRLCRFEEPKLADVPDADHDAGIEPFEDEIRALFAKNPYKHLSPTQAERLAVLIEEMEMAL
jgi:hypothetical protein